MENSGLKELPTRNPPKKRTTVRATHPSPAQNSFRPVLTVYTLLEIMTSILPRTAPERLDASGHGRTPWKAFHGVLTDPARIHRGSPVRAP